MPKPMIIKNDEIQCVRRMLLRGMNTNQIARKTGMSYHKARKIANTLRSTNPTIQKTECANRAPDPDPGSLMQMLMGDPPKERSAFGQRNGMWTPPDAENITPRPLVAPLQLTFA